MDGKDGIMMGKLTGRMDKVGQKRCGNQRVDTKSGHYNV